jgi:uncharacterized protein with PQ loop repeat
MHSHPITPGRNEPRRDQLLHSLMWGLSIFTMLMTIPQILTIWRDHQAAGVSALSWGAYLATAFVWLWYGIRKRDKNIYLPCFGWIVLDAAVVWGALIYG